MEGYDTNESFYCSDSPQSASAAPEKAKDEKLDIEELESASIGHLSSGQEGVYQCISTRFSSFHVDVVFVNVDAAAVKESEKRPRPTESDMNVKRENTTRRNMMRRKKHRQEKQVLILKSRPKSKSVVDDKDDSGTNDSSHSRMTNKKQKQDIEDQMITVYIHVQSKSQLPHPPSSAQSKGKSVLPPVSIKGLCFFQIHQTYNEFRAILANEFLWKLKLLPTDHVTWKYKKLANNSKKPLASSSGYEALILSPKERKVNYVIMISMPPPKIDDAVSQVYILPGP